MPSSHSKLENTKAVSSSSLLEYHAVDCAGWTSRGMEVDTLGSFHYFQRGILDSVQGIRTLRNHISRNSYHRRKPRAYSYEVMANIDALSIAKYFWWRKDDIKRVERALVCVRRVFKCPGNGIPSAILFCMQLFHYLCLQAYNLMSCLDIDIVDIGIHCRPVHLHAFIANLGRSGHFTAYLCYKSSSDNVARRPDCAKGELFHSTF